MVTITLRIFFVGLIGFAPTVDGSGKENGMSAILPRVGLMEHNHAGQPVSPHFPFILYETHDEEHIKHGIYKGDLDLLIATFAVDERMIPQLETLGGQFLSKTHVSIETLSGAVTYEHKDPPSRCPNEDNWRGFWWVPKMKNVMKGASNSSAREFDSAFRGVEDPRAIALFELHDGSLQTFSFGLNETCEVASYRFSSGQVHRQAVASVVEFKREFKREKENCKIRLMLQGSQLMEVPLVPIGECGEDAELSIIVGNLPQIVTKDPVHFSVMRVLSADKGSGQRPIPFPGMRCPQQQLPSTTKPQIFGFLNASKLKGSCDRMFHPWERPVCPQVSFVQE